MSFIRCSDHALSLIEYTGVPRRDIIFRGQANSAWRITPSIARGPDGLLRTKREVEDIELATLQFLFRRNKPMLNRGFHPLEYLMFLQHHDIPTRLIDWTMDILIGLFFACYDPKGEHKQEHGKLFMMSVNGWVGIMDIFTLKSNSRFNSFDRQAIHDAISEFRELETIGVLEPLVPNPRMRNQQGVFTIGPLHLDDQGKCLPFCTVMANHEPLRSRLVHKDNKEEILDELDECFGINPKTMFIETSVYKLVAEQTALIKRVTEDSLKIILESQGQFA